MGWAIPDNAETLKNRALPVLSYQHGTVYGKNEVPSVPDESPETQLMLAQFGGQGYVHPITHKSAEHSCNVEKGDNPPKN